MTKIFLTGTDADYELVRQLHSRLVEEGYEVVYRLTHGNEGPVVESDVLDDLHSAAVLIIVVGRSANENELYWIVNEAGHIAMERKNPEFVISLIQEGASIRFALLEQNALFFRDAVDMDMLKKRITVATLVNGNTENVVKPIDLEVSQTKGDQNEDLFKYQAFLRDLGYPVIADGKFGAQTRRALEEFQQENDMPVTGELDEATTAVLNRMSSEGNADWHSKLLSRKKAQRKGRPQQSKQSTSKSADVQTWILDFRFSDWPEENMVKGARVYHPCNSRQEGDSAAREYYALSPGDLIVGYDFGRSKKAVCIFELDMGVHPESNLGSIVSMSVEEVFAAPVDLSGLDDVSQFLKQLSDPEAPRLLRISEDVFTKIATVGRQPLISQTKAAPRSLLHSAAARLHSDDSEPEDQLQYEMYAEAIASIIRDSKTSPPPLNIAIIAPWGQGKTTLMRYIRKRFEKQPATEEVSATTHLTFGALWGWFGSSYKWVQKLKRLFVKDGAAPVLDELRKGIWKPQSLQHPTVWFNPWRYQSSDQIWAGLGHAMITQLVAKLNPVQREQFWLSLRLKRIDGNAIRKDIHKRVFESLIPVLIGGLVLAAVLITGAAFNAFAGLGWFVKSLITGGSIGVFALACFTNVRSFFSKSLEGKFAAYVREPDYEGKLGLFHEINHDLARVCSELISKEHPAIIFIDDLDRCSPKVVTEVIEAINLMMTSDFRNRCYFVFGMDAQMVSAALDAQYSSMAGKFADKEKIHGSVGWYFLDKFIQLPFFIPVLNSEDKKKFLNRFFYAPVEPEKKQEVKNITESEVEADAAAAVENVEQRVANTKKYEANPIAYQSAVVKKLMERSKDSTEIVAEVIRYANYLDGSPRGLKRFANLLRFYHTQQQMRMHYTTSAMQGSTASTSSLAKWLVINLRWPQMVRWVQWEYEELLLHSAEPEVKAKHIDDLINQLGKKLKTGADAYAAWLELLSENEKKEQKKSAHLKWLYDRDLFLLLHENRDEDASLEKALQYDVW